MDRFRYVAALIICSMIYPSSTINITCGRSGNCFCINDIYHTEFQCPDKQSPKMIIKVMSEYDEVDIQCTDKINWQSLKLPLVEIGDVDYFSFQNCSLPRNFGEIMRRLGVNNTKEFIFNNSGDFANITLTAVYFERVQNVEKLILNSNDIRNIDEDTLTSLNKLKELDLTHNKVKLSEGLFKHLAKLKLLYLGDNELSHLPSEIFQNLTELKQLHLWYNRLTTISSSTFKNLRNLELVELSRNNLEVLPEDIFYNLENLKTVSLSTNKLQRLPEHLFENNKLLEFVNINRNSNLTYLPNNLFSNLTKLGKILLSDCGLTNLPNNLFDGSIHLQHIYLQTNEIEIIPENIFKDLEQLQNLDFSYNKIRDLPDELFSSLTQLKTLNLESNLLTKIQREPFRKLKSLEKLNLKNNRINFIEMTSFRSVYNLKEIILANNYVDLPKSYKRSVSLFMNNQELLKVDLSYNNITSIDENFLPTNKLRELDLSYNKISLISFNEVFVGALPIQINLEHNNISTIDFDDAEETARRQENLATSNSGNRKVFLNGNPLECNCHIYNFARYFDLSVHSMVRTLLTIEADQLTCASPNDFINFPVTKLRQNMLTCSLKQLRIEGNFTEKCSYGFRPWDKSLIVSCTNSNFTKVPELILPTENFFNKIEVYLQGNLITLGPRENMGYENVTKLDLSFNNISEITWIPSKLQVLKLDNNNISYINIDVLTKLNTSEHLTNITLANNPWKCDCSTVNLAEFVVSSLARQRIDNKDVHNITCKDGKLLYRLTANDICPTNATLILALGITASLIALSIAILTALYYRFHQEVKVWMFAHNLCLRFVTEDEIDRDKLYDAFISYSHQDEKFVLNELLPVLEQGPQPYKLCVHIRDWIAGEFITTQIATSVTESRRTLVILSRHFLESEWGKMEFRTAHKQAIHEGRARVILILYGNIDVDSDLDDELKAYVRTNTYVKWGDPWFWDKLKYALPHSRVKVKENSQKSQNIMVAINEGLDKLDDQLDLINGTLLTPTPGSTPPADQLRLKNNPLDFTPGEALPLTPPAESELNILAITVNR